MEIRASVEGYIMNVLINEGQFVKAGQVLFEIDPRPFNENIKNASAIYLDLGFESLAHFSDSFKKMFGVLPSKLHQNE